MDGTEFDSINLIKIIQIILKMKKNKCILCNHRAVLFLVNVFYVLLTETNIFNPRLHYNVMIKKLILCAVI